ncbi:hypothetical protein PO856_002192, partial [Pectobacterium brasiliense]|uniref:hypothetical protein n=1 Tax=Pectobacterium brasiliense TaxID=180957 RepID=UPI0024069EAE
RELMRLLSSTRRIVQPIILLNRSVLASLRVFLRLTKSFYVVERLMFLIIMSMWNKPNACGSGDFGKKRQRCKVVSLDWCFGIRQI